MEIRSPEVVLVSSINDRNQTVLHVATECLWVDKEGSVGGGGGGSNTNKGRRRRIMEFIGKVLQRMPKDGLAKADSKGNTALHLAMLTGFTPALKALVSKNSKPALILDKDKFMPIHVVAQLGRRDAYLYLLEANKINAQLPPGINPFDGLLLKKTDLELKKEQKLED